MMSFDIRLFQAAGFCGKYDSSKKTNSNHIISNGIRNKQRNVINCFHNEFAHLFS